ncbi:MAG: hypothetical protein UR28_C0014G0015 [Candidatus Peregrinibacteria bacterium GW2011_GWF2_33_10]|nr:MAG: hypothetical protein UR28_C0014G0015 [Candidatus Peregrinibacteria bacterium GW2011_GWF2_33_10]OGJ45157.1 MAG: hypothetical protein A2263_05400 [Candidatus Peregrinibacteria bacterium RIFOXYA2_FULL_33_21]OGJ46305.1 MAG: hypothetical protein A2272_03430 [Candidatus Peregrinibacteria bacterium RIFOXYA12_FULL_33_12]OGJ50826.1 MAG: hypothetical protein A2307_02170 [Candidatus Peregrinibacteria bacterium RIFOXYB2_FULL_33_20]
MTESQNPLTLEKLYKDTTEKNPDLGVIGLYTDLVYTLADQIWKIRAQGRKVITSKANPNVLTNIKSKFDLEDVVGGWLYNKYREATLEADLDCDDD